MKTIRLIIVGAMLTALLFGDLAASLAFAQDTISVAQQEQPRRRRTLMDLLFGDDREPARQQQQRRQRVQRERPRQPANTRPANPKPSPSIADVPPPEPKVEKAASATRVAVFGDSLAVDLGKALERFYAEDPNLAVISMGVGSSGFVRDDFYDWNKAINEQIAANSFDLAVMIIGINDRQEINADGKTYETLSNEWTRIYTGRLNVALSQLRAANKPVIWVGLPPMQASSYSSAMSQINAIQRLASYSGGAEFVDIYDRFADENGRYSTYGPDLSGNNVQMRKDDGIHFSSAGSDKLAYYVNEAIGKFYSAGGGLSVEVADPLLGTDAQTMMRAPFQGLGQVRQLEVAGAVIALSSSPPRAMDMLTAQGSALVSTDFDLEKLVQAPIGRVDAFGVGVRPEAVETE